MERRPRRTFTLEFKQNLLDLIRIKGVKATQAAKDFDMRVELIYKWLRDSREESQADNVGDKTQSELKQFQRRLTDIEEERDILKKALGIFTQPPKQNSNL
ncbi:MAG: hypothetical protein Q8903_07755 [Bacteroidota bacterium]|nr:hypothetical protein [Bacteroidota bacterium]